MGAGEPSRASGTAAKSITAIWTSLAALLRRGAARIGASRALPASSHPDGRFQWTDCAEFAERLQLGSTTVIDVRGPDEFAGPPGHIPGAVNLPLQALPMRLSELQHLAERPVLLVCHTDQRSAAAAALLSTAGFRRVEVLRGGMQRWRALGLPLGRADGPEPAAAPSSLGHADR
jgi:rhodanese-related sulfurtransferase